MIKILINRFYRTSALFLLVLCMVALWFGYAYTITGILAGGILGVMNVRGLSKGVEGLIGGPSAAKKLFFHGTFRLMIIGSAIMVLAYTRAVSLPALLVGFIAIYIVLVFEGLRVAMDKKLHEKDKVENSSEEMDLNNKEDCDA